MGLGMVSAVFSHIFADSRAISVRLFIPHRASYTGRPTWTRVSSQNGGISLLKANVVYGTVARRQLTSKISAMDAACRHTMPQSDGVAKVAAGGRDDICALDGKSLPISLRRWLLTSSLVGSPIRMRRFPLNYDISVHLGMGMSPTSG